MKILYVENHKAFANAVCLEFLNEHDVKVVPTIAEAKYLLGSHSFDLLLVDYDLDDGKGDELVRELRKNGYQGKIVAASSHEKGNGILLQAGADVICGKMEFHKITEILSEFK